MKFYLTPIIPGGYYYQLYKIKQNFVNAFNLSINFTNKLLPSISDIELALDRGRPTVDLKPAPDTPDCTAGKEKLKPKTRYFILGFILILV